MPKLTEYELAYICYYSERVELTALAAGFEPKLKLREIMPLLDDLRKKGIFDFYKNTYQELLEE
ncbi:hypothetical protein [Bacillus thuringiensis]|uniref:hypothetical protein n=1 Tax=Bacillus cereus group TaxID=86661 RepID=UPI0018CCAD8C|nr:hypothetical protein [Bacillus thuringiensis]MEB9334433.1 hypothetical protein [Bacillus cereus]HEF1856751.1 hypothetical protein [Bacillus cereus]HEF1869115.1 hypothetical protein [Bacillus cereus]HEF1879639.1 hypothetical protein [Bacillus cereus]HEF1885700.1 hypothetical protein [Bacillus cereus]